jgi:hypothetical protein
MAGRAKENIPRGSLKYNFVYLRIRNIYIYIYMIWNIVIVQYYTEEYL